MKTKGGTGADQKCRLIYRSDTSWDLLSNESLLQLANSSAKNNEGKKITGLLLLSGESFLQVLEGPASAVNQLYNKIIQDKRHRAVTLLSYEQTEQSYFAEWSMHVVDLHELRLEQREFLSRKYPQQDGYIRVPHDHRQAFSLLMDARFFSLPEQEFARAGAP